MLRNWRISNMNRFNTICITSLLLFTEGKEEFHQLSVDVIILFAHALLLQQAKRSKFIEIFRCGLS